MVFQPPKSPHKLFQEATQFLQRVRNQEQVNEDELRDEEAGLLSPTYVITSDSKSFPIAKRTVTENLRISDLLYRELTSLVEFPKIKNVRNITNIEEALEYCSKVKTELVVAFSPIVELIQSKRSTRSALSDALAEARNCGFTEYIDFNRKIFSLDNHSRGLETNLDLFHTKVLLGTVGHGKKIDREVISKGMEVGGGWLSISLGYKGSKTATYLGWSSY